MITFPSKPHSPDFVAFKNHLIMDMEISDISTYVVAATSERRPPRGIVITTACFYFCAPVLEFGEHKVEGPATDQE